MQLCYERNLINDDNHKTKRTVSRDLQLTLLEIEVPVRPVCVFNFLWQLRLNNL